MCLLETGGPSLFTVNSDGGTIPYSWANGMRYELSVGSIYSVKKFRYTSQKNPLRIYVLIVNLINIVIIRLTFLTKLCNKSIIFIRKNLVLDKIYNNI